MKQTMYMATRGMIRILDEKPYSHQKMNIFGTYASLKSTN